MVGMKVVCSRPRLRLSEGSHSKCLIWIVVGVPSLGASTSCWMKLDWDWSLVVFHRARRMPAKAEATGSGWWGSSRPNLYLCLPRCPCCHLWHLKWPGDAGLVGVLGPISRLAVALRFKITMRFPNLQVAAVAYPKGCRTPRAWRGEFRHGVDETTTREIARFMTARKPTNSAL